MCSVCTADAPVGLLRLLQCNCLNIGHVSSRVFDDTRRLQRKAPDGAVELLRVDRCSNYVYLLANHIDLTCFGYAGVLSLSTGLCSSYALPLCVSVLSSLCVRRSPRRMGWVVFET